MILSFYKKGKLKIKDLAEAAEVSVQYVKDLIEASKNEEKTEIETEKAPGEKNKA